MNPESPTTDTPIQINTNNLNITFEGDDLPLESLPIPTGWQVVLAPIDISSVTAGGIILMNDDVEIQKAGRFISKVLAMGPLAYTGNKFKEHPDSKSIKPWCKVGDIVSTGQYTGSKLPCLNSKGKSFYLRVVADDEIKTVIPDIGVIDVQ